jgi:ABC-2 type transport system permease protein
VASFQGVALILIAPLAGVHYSLPLMLEIFALQLLLAFSITAFGVMAAARIKQMQSFMALMQLLILPLFFLSGAIYPVSNLPRWLEILNRLDPLTYAVDAMRRAVFAHLDISEIARKTLDPGVTWWHFHVPIIVDAAVILGLGLAMLGVAIVEFSRVD